MTVSELIILLQSYPKDAIVVNDIKRRYLYTK